MKYLFFWAGAFLGATLSWIVNHSVGWSMLHFLCNWVYVIYWLITKTSFYAYLESLVAK